MERRGRPRREVPRVPITVRVEPEQAQALKDEAARRGISINALLESVIRLLAPIHKT